MNRTRRPVRTSETDPLRIDALPAGSEGGRVGLTLCPGKHDWSTDGTRWERDLRMDLEAIRTWAPAVLLTLVEDHEFGMLGVPHLGQAVRASGIAWHHLPIVDGSAPDERFERGWASVGPAVRAILESGGRVLVHCRGGLGRAGTVASRILVEAGVAPGEAVRKVRATRPGAIETTEQLDYVLRMRWIGLDPV